MPLTFTEQSIRDFIGAAEQAGKKIVVICEKPGGTPEDVGFLPSRNTDANFLDRVELTCKQTVPSLKTYMKTNGLQVVQVAK
jgi:hypothetical protein